MNPSLVTAIPLFSGISRRHRATLAASADVVDVPAGWVLTKEGDAARELFVVVDGSAEVYVDGERASIAGRGSIVGELGLMARARRSATVVARSDMRLLVVGARELGGLMHRFPSIRERVSVAAAAHTAGTAA